MKLINKSWYWLSHPHEGDIFYPVFILDDEYMLVDGKRWEIAKNAEATLTLAIMPDQ
jgi:hypothetical protein